MKSAGIRNFNRIRWFGMDMKTLALSLSAGFFLILTSLTAEAAPQSVKLEVKKHLVESDRNKVASFGGQVSKAYTLRVEITNTGKETITGAKLSGTALVMRARAMNERLSSEPIAAMEIPELKPNGRVTLDLGRIDIHKLELRQREMEETFEEWQVVCTQGESELAKVESSGKFESLNKDASDQPGIGRKGRGKKAK